MEQARPSTFVGIDVSKSKLDVAVRPQAEQWQVAHEATAFPEHVTRLCALQPKLIVLEATGGLEISLVTALAAEHLPVVVVNPRQVHAFGKAMGRLAKTDRLDADCLAHFGEVIQPT